MNESSKEVKKPWRRLATDDSRIKNNIFQQREVRRRLDFTDNNACFGASLANRVERDLRMKSNLKKLDAPEDVMESHHTWIYAPLKRALHRQREQFVNIAHGSVHKRFAAYEFLEVAVKNPLLTDRIIEEIAGMRKIECDLSRSALLIRGVDALEKNMEETMLVDKLYTLISRKSKRISPELWADILVEYRKHFENEEKKFLEKELPKLKRNFLSRWEQVAGTPVFPMPLDEIQKIMDGLTFRVVDGLTDSLTDISGSYGRQQEEVSISIHTIANGSFAEVEDVFTHEVFHALSARMVLMKERTFAGMDMPLIANPRVGLRMPEQEKGEKFRWLNEAVTESLTARLLLQTPRTYLDECGILDYLCDEGHPPILFNVFSKAYFENQDAPSEDGRSIPRWRAMWKAVQESFSPTFLLRIDKKVEEIGAKETLRLLRTGVLKP